MSGLPWCDNCESYHGLEAGGGYCKTITGLKDRIACLEAYLPKFKMGDQVMTPDGNTHYIEEGPCSVDYLLDNRVWHKELRLSHVSKPKPSLADRLKDLVKDIDDNQDWDSDVIVDQLHELLNEEEEDK